MEPIILHTEPKIADLAYRDSLADKAKIVFLTANPKDTEALNINKEFMAVQDELGDGKKEIQLRLLLDVGKDEFARALLKERPTILHFSGHGTADQGLVFQNEDDYSETMGLERLVQTLREFADTLECVVLNACYSEAQAQAIAHYIPNVIGTNNAIPDVKAIAFARDFYMGISEGMSYEKAFRFASIQVLDQAGGQPVLYRWKADAKPISTPQETAWSDPLTGEEYPLVTINGLTWMGKNYAFYDDENEECAYYDDDDANAKYGCLYSWEGAQDMCPEGWRLPTLEEWKSLCESLGGFGELSYTKNSRSWDQKGDPIEAYNQLIEDGASGLNLILGGGYSSEADEYQDMDTYGAYWTADEINEDEAYCIELTLNSDEKNGIYSVPAYKVDYLAVRYVKM